MGRIMTVNEQIVAINVHYLTAQEDGSQLLVNLLNKMLREQTQYLKYFKKFGNVIIP